MYASLYYLFSDLFGIKIEALKMVQTFGFFLVIAFLVSGYVFALELKRKESGGLIFPFIEKRWIGKKATPLELVSAFAIAFIIGYKLVYVALNFSDFVNNTQGYMLSVQGNVWGGLIAAVGYTYLQYREKEKHKLAEPKMEQLTVFPHQLVGNVVLIAAGAGILGAKVFDSLENFHALLTHPIDTLLSFSGLTIYGGLIFGAVAVLYYTSKRGISIIHTVDAAAPAMMIAYSLGRIGCQMAGDGDWGIVNAAPKPQWLNFLPDWMWSFSFPHNVINEGVAIPGCTGAHCFMLNPPVFPTPFYETVTCALLFLVLWLIRKRITAPGVIISIYLLMNGVERFLIELIRVNIKYHLFGYEITQAQLISPLFIIAGIGGIIYFRRKANRIHG